LNLPQDNDPLSRIFAESDDHDDDDDDDNVEMSINSSFSRAVTGN
jgi:hypothetical protein